MMILIHYHLYNYLYFIILIIELIISYYQFNYSIENSERNL